MTPDDVLESLQQGRSVSRRAIEAFAATERVLEVTSLLDDPDTKKVTLALHVLAIAENDATTDAVVRVAESNPDASVQRAAASALLRMGPVARAHLARLTVADPTPERVHALLRAPSYPSSRPAAAEALSEIAGNAKAPDASRLMAGLAVLYTGWASGYERIRNGFKAAGYDGAADLWYSYGCPPVQHEFEQFDPRDAFAPDFFLRLREALNTLATQFTASQEALEKRSEEAQAQRLAQAQRISVQAAGLGRNDDCFCNSQKKLKRCCGDLVDTATRDAHLLKSLYINTLGMTRTPFDRWDEEGPIIRSLVLARHPREIDVSTLPNALLRWIAILQLCAVGDDAGACAEGERLVGNWGDDPDIDYPRICSLTIVLFLLSKREVPESLIHAHVEQMGLPYLHSCLDSLTNRDDLESFVEVAQKTLRLYAQNLEVLLTITAALIAFDDDDLSPHIVPLLSQLHDALTPFQHEPDATDALRALAPLRKQFLQDNAPTDASDNDEPVTQSNAELYPNSEFSTCFRVLTDHDMLDEAQLLERTLAFWRAGATLELDESDLDPESVKPWNREQALRARKAEKTARTLDDARTRIHEALLGHIRDHAGAVYLARGNNHLVWLAPASADAATACAVAAAAARLSSEVGLPIVANEYHTMECREGRIVLVQPLPADAELIVDFAQVTLAETFDTAHLALPACFEIPEAVSHRLNPGRLPRLLDATHAFALKADRAGLHILQLAAEIGATRTWKGIEATPPRTLPAPPLVEAIPLVAPDPTPVEADSDDADLSPLAQDAPLEPAAPPGHAPAPTRPPRGSKRDTSLTYAQRQLALTPSTDDIARALHNLRVGYTVADAVRRAAADAADILDVWRSAHISAHESVFPRPSDVYDALMALAELAREQQRATREGRGMGTWFDFLQRYNLRYRSRESVSTMGAFGDQRIFNDKNKRMEMQKHVTIGGGSTNRCLQIHFELLDGRMQIGHCGAHLEYVNQKT